MSDAPLVCDVCGGEVWGIEMPGVYDGVLFYACRGCRKTWERWSGDDRLARAAREHAARWEARK